MSNVSNNFTGRTSRAINSVSVLHVKRIAAAAGRQIQFVIHRYTVQEVPGPFETQLWVLVQQEVGLIGSTESMSKLDVGPRPARANSIIVVYSYQETGRKQRDQGSGLNLVPGVFYKSRDLSRRLTATALDAGAVAVPEVGGIELSNSVV